MKSVWFFFVLQLLFIKGHSQYAQSQNVDVSSLTSSQGFKIFKSLGGPVGFALTTNGAGDVNGDGIDDVIIGAQIDDGGNGMVYVVYGSDTPIAEVDPSFPDFSPNKGFKIYDSTAMGNDALGISATFAGDINGDGTTDIIVGSHNKYNLNGAAFVIYGSNSLQLQDVDIGSSSFNPLQGFRITDSIRLKSSIGVSTNYAGDINGDGVDDVIVGAVNENVQAGAAYVIFGNKTPNLNIDLGDINFSPAQGFRIWNSAANSGDYLGAAVSSVGDVNGDGTDDVIVGAYREDNIKGAAYVIYGRRNGIVDVDVGSASFNPSQGFKIYNSGGQAGDSLSSSVVGIGDINGDNIDDITIGAYGEGGNLGAAYVIYGKNGNFANVDLGSGSFSPNQGFKIYNSILTPPAYFGFYTNRVGDINGDSIPDLIISAAMEELKGAVYIIFGRKSSFPNDIDFGSADYDLSQGYKLFASAGNTGNFFGVACGSGDFNRDNIHDLVIGAAGDNGGTAYVVYGVNLTCSNGCQTCTNSISCQDCIPGFELSGAECIDPNPPEPEPEPSEPSDSGRTKSKNNNPNFLLMNS